MPTKLAGTVSSWLTGLKIIFMVRSRLDMKPEYREELGRAVWGVVVGDRKHGFGSANSC